MDKLYELLCLNLPMYTEREMLKISENLYGI